MKKRFEEKLSMLAFGDLSPEETSQLKKDVAGDAEAMRVLAEYEGMRAGLRAMADIPEHQLSTDRLRHTILREGLKPKNRPQWGWLWMPAAAAAVAFGIAFMRFSHQTMLPVGAGGSPLSAMRDAEPVDNMSPDPFAFASASGEVLSVATPTAPVRTASHASSRHRSRDEVRLLALKEQVLEEFQNEMMADNIRSLDSYPTRAMASGRRTKSASSPIVLVDSAKDDATGAQKATEVDSPSNVVVGG